jgi:hypothetical protein
MQPLEGTEDPLRILRRDADTVVLHAQHPAVAALLCGQVDMGRASIRFW